MPAMLQLVLGRSPQPVVWRASLAIRWPTPNVDPRVVGLPGQQCDVRVAGS